MQKIILITALLLVGLATKLTAQNSGTYKTIEDWTYWQPVHPDYEMALDTDSESANQDVFTIKSIKSNISGFGTLTKNIKPEVFANKTVKMTGYVKCENVKNWAGLWMRVDYYSTDVLAFDNMRDRKIRKTKDWTKYEVVLFVPAEATSISYGVLLDGTGQIWFKDVKLEVVDDAIPETGYNKGKDHKIISFEKRAKAIANEIKKITVGEKDALKAEIEIIDKDLAEGVITKSKAEDLKLEKAKVRAAAIDAKVAIEQQKLEQLVQDKVDGKVEGEKDDRHNGRTVVLGNNSNPIGSQTEINVTSMKVYNGQEDKEERQSKRTTSQLVFAAGLNNVVTDGSVKKSDFRFLGSHFYELGISYNTRLLDNSNVLHAKYGLSLQYNNLRATDNRSFEVNGNQTNLTVQAIELIDSRFRNVSLVVPLHLEFDFSKPEVKNDKTYFKTHQSIRLGLGGFAGVNVKTKQILQYENSDLKSTEKTKGDFNSSNFIYGLSTYIGYKATSLYLKYDLSPVFKDNLVKQNNVSLGVRFDFN